MLHSFYYDDNYCSVVLWFGHNFRVIMGRRCED